MIFVGFWLIDIVFELVWDCMLLLVNSIKCVIVICFGFGNDVEIVDVG